jgi:4,5-DOPA dioxygenase extradiol
MGSGNIVHNLRDAFGQMHRGSYATPPWAEAFDQEVAEALTRSDLEFLTRALDADGGHLSHPTPDHYFPLLYAAGASTPQDGVRFPVTGFDMGSLSMRCVLFG